VGLYFTAQAIQLYRKRPRAAADLLRARENQHARIVEVARNRHEREEALRSERHSEEEALRTRIREAIVTEDSEILAELLEVELSNEELPLPVEFDIEFDGVRQVRLEVELPTLDAMPLTVSSVTKSGKFSERKMAQRDRVDLYKDVCAGLALRLVHEVFRVLPFVEHVDLAGLITQTDPATGNPARHLVLRLSTDRTPFLRLSLDNVDPSEALAHLGGEMKINREGIPQRLETSAGY
jgi:hypothetical protein